MKSRWSDREAARFVEEHGPCWGEALALRTYTARLLGADPSLVLHGGGNTSLKGTLPDLAGREVPVLFIKASGRDLAGAAPEDHVALDLKPLRLLAGPRDLDDEALRDELLRCRRHPRAPAPSIETPVHALIPARYVDHTHAEAVLALGSRPGGEEALNEVLGEEVILLPYAAPGQPLARAVARALAERPEARAMVWLHHGTVTWGETAREAYEMMIELVGRAEEALAEKARPIHRAAPAAAVDLARERLARVAPVLRGLLARPTGVPDRPHRRTVLRPLADAETLGLLAAPGARELLESPPLTTDHLIRTGPWPLWAEDLPWEDPEALREHLEEALEGYARRYREYAARGGDGPSKQEPSTAASPRVVLVPGLGALCAGADAVAAGIARDITARTLQAKARIAASGSRFEPLGEEHLVHMEHRRYQRAKLPAGPEPPLAGEVALVTGAAGAIGAGICRGLLAAGCHVLATDLPGPRLDSLAEELAARYPQRVAAQALDVTEPGSVEEGFAAAARAWGGVDLLVVNAGLAHVASLEELDLAEFRRLARVNTEGTLLLLRQAARHFRLQGTGGDVVVVSTKNVFAPGAAFGAYSATKAASHQLARIASLELAPLDVRVNMVAPDAVFGDSGRPSGLWQEVGPERMRARGLDPEGLEEHYRQRNLLKARVTPEHVAEAVLFFAARKTPTTGATLPVDGGLPDATPR